MRILIYWEQESWGGVDVQLLELLSTWHVHDDEFVLVVNKGNTGFERLQSKFESIKNVHCEIIKSYSHNELNRRVRNIKYSRFLTIILHFLQPLTYCLTVRMMSKFIKSKGDFDLLLVDNGGYPAAWGCICALEAGKKAGIENCFLLVHHAATISAPFMGWFERMIDRKVTRLCNAIICISQATKQALLLRRWINDEEVRMRVIHNDIKLNPNSDVNTIFDIRKKIKVVENEYIIGIAGRITPYKGHEDLIFALSRLSLSEQQRIRLVFTGDCEPLCEQNRLIGLASKLGVSERVHFMGYVQGSPVDIITQFDLLVVATKSFEGFGLTLIEAMRMGVPILTTNVGAIPEVVNSENAMLVPPDSPRHMAEALSSFLNDNPTWQKRANIARERLLLNKVDMASEYRRLFLECSA
jgi:glycosyltransferase involved in cell wall biosynthesis